MKASLYARYSTEHQSAASVEDQFRVCRERAAREGWVVVAAHGDDAVSGTTPVEMRQGGRTLIADMTARRFDVLVVEGLDRLSRDQVQQEVLIRRMEHAGIRIVGVSDGYDSQQAGRKLMRGMRGLINEVFLDDLRAKTHRGQTGKVLGGYVAGGKSYGYRLVKHVDGERSIGSTYAIDESQAPWVRWIFERYAEGMGCRAIAHELNRQSVPSPRGGTWCLSAIYGSPKKGSRRPEQRSLRWPLRLEQRRSGPRIPTGTPGNALTGRRSEWHEHEVPELRTGRRCAVGSACERGCDRRARSARASARRSIDRRSALFSGLMRCPELRRLAHRGRRDLLRLRTRQGPGPYCMQRFAPAQIDRRREADRQLCASIFCHQLLQRSSPSRDYAQENRSAKLFESGHLECATRAPE